MKQHFDEDRAELEAHLAERVRAYIELGETPEQAALSACEKFGETETVLRELRQQQTLRQPIVLGALTAVSWFLGCSALHFLLSGVLSAAGQSFSGSTNGDLIGRNLLHAYTVQAPVALLVAWQGAMRFPRHGKAILLGILAPLLAFAILGRFRSSEVNLGLLLGLLPTLHGALVGLRLSHRAHRTRRQL